MITLQEEQRAAKIAARNRVRQFRREDADLEDLEQVAMLYILERGPHEELHYAIRNGYNGIAEFRRKLYGSGDSARSRATKVYADEGYHFASLYERAGTDPTPGFEHIDHIVAIEADLTDLERHIIAQQFKGVQCKDIGKALNLPEWQIHHTLHLLRKRVIDKEKNNGRCNQQALDHWRNRQALRDLGPARVPVDRQRDAPGMEDSR